MTYAGIPGYRYDNNALTTMRRQQVQAVADDPDQLFDFLWRKAHTARPDKLYLPHRCKANAVHYVGYIIAMFLLQEIETDQPASRYNRFSFLI